MLTANHIFCLPIDIKSLICTTDEALWWFILYDDSFRNYYLRNRNEFVTSFTRVIRNRSKTCYELLVKQHRENDLPAIEYISGSTEWLLNGKYYTRENGEPSIIYRIGQANYWYYDNEIHRDNDLPAIITTGERWWYKHGLRHRDNDKPAVKCTDGKRYYYKNDHRYTPWFEEVD